MLLSGEAVHTSDALSLISEFCNTRLFCLIVGIAGAMKRLGAEVESLVSFFFSRTIASLPILTVPCADAFNDNKKAGNTNWKKYFTQGILFFGISMLLSN